MSTAPPTISVIVPAYNAAPTIGETLASLSAQTLPPWEVIVIDDGSADATATIAGDFARSDRRFALHRLPGNRGVAAARNAGMELARGKYLAFCDADDIALPERLEKQALFLEQNPEIAGCGSAVEFFGQRSGIVAPETSAARLTMKFLFTNEIFMPSLTVRTGFLRAHDIRFDENNPETVEDWLFFAAILNAGGALANLPEVLVRYRRSPGQISARLRDTADCRSTLLRSRMISRQLGIPASAQDMEAHVAISPCHWPLHRDVPAAAFDPDRQRRWLERLSDANRTTGRFPAQPFDQLLAEVMDDFLQRTGHVARQH